MIFVAKVCEAAYTCAKGVVKLDGMQGLSAVPTQETKIQKQKGGAGGMLLVGIPLPKQQQRKAVSANQMDKQNSMMQLTCTNGMNCMMLLTCTRPTCFHALSDKGRYCRRQHHPRSWVVQSRDHFSRFGLLKPLRRERIRHGSGAHVSAGVTALHSKRKSLAS